MFVYFRSLENAFLKKVSPGISIRLLEFVNMWVILIWKRFSSSEVLLRVILLT